MIKKFRGIILGVVVMAMAGCGGGGGGSDTAKTPVSADVTVSLTPAAVQRLNSMQNRPDINAINVNLVSSAAINTSAQEYVVNSLPSVNLSQALRLNATTAAVILMSTASIAVPTDGVLATITIPVTTPVPTFTIEQSIDNSSAPIPFATTTPDVQLLDKTDLAVSVKLNYE